MEKTNEKLINIHLEIGARIGNLDIDIKDYNYETEFFSLMLIPMLIPILALFSQFPLFGVIILLIGLVRTGKRFFKIHSCKHHVEELEKLKNLIEIIIDNFDEHFYEAYVLTDYFKDEDYNLKKLKQINEYLSKFDKNKPNSCFNEVGMKYNYSPISEEKVLEIEEKQNNLSVNNENGFEIITDTRLVDKYFDESFFLEDSSRLPISRRDCTNLVLKASVFDSSKKKLNKENNGYTHIEISIGKVKVLTIDKRIK